MGPVHTEQHLHVSALKRARMRVDEKGTIVEIVDHVIDGPRDKARAYLIDLFKRLGWRWI